MSWTYATLKTAILDNVESDETTLAANLDNIIMMSEERILRTVQLPAFRKNSTALALTASSEYLTYPTDLLSVYSFAVDRGASGYSYLTLVDVSTIREMYPVSTAEGTPKYYATYDESQFIVGPTPSAPLDVEINYFYKPASIVTATTSWLGDNAVSCLLSACILEAYIFLKGEPDLLAVYNQRYKEDVVQLKNLGEGYMTHDSYRSGMVRKDRI